MIHMSQAQERNYVTILAIYDESTSSLNHDTLSTSEGTSPKTFSTVVEKYNEKTLQENREPYFKSTQHFMADDWRQNTDTTRKSRISDTYFEAKERIERTYQPKRHWLASFDASNYRYYKITLSADTRDTFMGVEISAVPNPNRPSHLLAVEVRNIEKNGRLAKDERLRIGDQIVEINGIPCEQISLARARLHIRELQSVSEPSFAFFRRIYKYFLNDKSITSIVKKSQQKANTTKISQCERIKLTKGVDGFGFSYAGRINAKGEHLYYVKGVRRDQGLSVSDRILQLDDIDLACIDQIELTSLLKSKQIGETITMLINREQKTNEEILPPSIRKQQIPSKQNKKQEFVKEVPAKNVDRDLAVAFNTTQQQRLCFDIPLNDSPGAGLGISVKAQRMAGIDMGLYVRSILHGSAAYKDGRLCINDRLVGIEDLDLMKYALNGDALNAFMHILAHLPSEKDTVRIFVERNKQMIFNNDQQEMGHTLTRSGSDTELNQPIEFRTFVRDTAIRRSISEKRALGLHNDPINLRTYQRIVHQRQISAPAVSSAHRSRRSLHEPFLRNEQRNPEQNKSIPTTAFLVDSLNSKSQSGAHQTSAFRSPNCDISNSQDYCLSSELPLEKHTKMTTISSSKSQPEELIEQKQIDDEGICRPNKRRSSFGTGLLKFFSKNYTKHEQSSSMKQHTPRPPPPPYRSPWQQSESQVMQSFCTNQQNHYKFGTNNNHFSHWKNYSFRFNNSNNQFGLVEGVHHWPSDDAGVRKQYQQKQYETSRTTTNPSISVSPIGLPQLDPLDDNYPQRDHKTYWHSLPREVKFHNGNCMRFGRIQPSAVFYDESNTYDGARNSNWVIRC